MSIVYCTREKECTLVACPHTDAGIPCVCVPSVYDCVLSVSHEHTPGMTHGKQSWSRGFGR